MELKKCKRFTKTDWDRFGGATNFKDGSDPYIHELILVDIHRNVTDCTIIGDGFGVSVTFDHSGCSKNFTTQQYVREIKSEQATLLLLRHIEKLPALTHGWLVDHGFSLT